MPGPVEPDIRSIAAAILSEQSAAMDRVDPHRVDGLIEAVSAANRIFVQGEGRSGLVMRMFAMRLMHLGHQVYVVGETITPAIGSGDLLLACSGSGETEATVQFAAQARNSGAVVAALSAAPDSRLVEISSTAVIVPAPHKRGDAATGSMQFGGSLFEQTALLICESIVAGMAALEGFASMSSRHANLE